jgi:glycosyltransferase involved in cell wall biosynthesis
MLDACLQSVQADPSAATREIIVVDNGSTDETRDVVKSAVGRGRLPVRYVVEPRVGKAHALNTAVAVARGAFLLFTDDDVIVADGWADGLLSGFSSPEVGAVGGPVLPAWPGSPPEWLNGPHAEVLTLAVADFGPEPRLLTEDEWPVGANMAVRTEVARSYSLPFDPKLGPRGHQAGFHDDVAIISRIARTHKIGYAPAAVVHHRVRPERIDWRYMRRAWFQFGVHTARIERLNGAEQLALPRRLVRAARTGKGALSIQRRNNGIASPGAAEAEREFRSFMWAGKHVEMLFERFPAVSDWIGAHLV